MWFDEQWMGECQTSELAKLAAGTAHLPGEVVEIGVWQGWSAIPLARAIKPAVLHAVDHWLGDASGSIPPELLARDNYGLFLRNVAEVEAEGAHVTVHKMDWRKWLESWDGKPIRFLHLDASHTRDEVRDNILAILPLMVPGGVLAGDDWDWPEVEAGIRAALGETVQPQILFNKLWWVVT